MENENSWNPWPLARTLTAAAVVTLVVGGLVIANAAKGAPVPAPAKYEVFKDSEGTFQCEYPAGWRRRGELSGGAIMSTVSFAKEEARIEVTSDLMGSLVSDVMRGPGGMPSPTGLPGGTSAIPGLEKLQARVKPPVDVLHEAERKTLAKSVESYQEQPAKKFQSRAGDARYSEFTASGGLLVGKLHGYRATLLGNERRVSLVCQCPERDWKTLDKPFLRIIGSAGPVVR